MSERTIITTLRQALKVYRGDDLERARRTFRGMTEEEMGLPHGHSGLTRREVIAEYEAFDAKINRAAEWVSEKEGARS